MPIEYLRNERSAQKTPTYTSKPQSNVLALGATPVSRGAVLPYGFALPSPRAVCTSAGQGAPGPLQEADLGSNLTFDTSLTSSTKIYWAPASCVPITGN